jgi:hypothetical protein
MKNRQRIVNIAHHRNGVSGLPFHVAIVHEIDQEGTERDMLVVRFDSRADRLVDGVVCAAFDIEQISKYHIEFGVNSWRGDTYHQIVDARIAEDKKRNQQPK